MPLRSHVRKLKPALPGYLSKQTLVYVAAFTVIGGAAMFLISHAASSSSFIEPETGSVANGAFTVPDTNASGDSAVKFAAPGAATTLPNPGTWTNVTGSLAGMPSECGDMSGLFSVPNSSTIIGGVALKGLWSSTGNGGTWAHLGTGTGSDTITNRPLTLVYDPANPSIFYESGIYNGGGVYKTTDNGLTFKQLGNIGHVDHVSIDFTDPNRQTLVAGGHEQSQTLYKSTNGGSTWTNIGANLPGGTGSSTQPVVINSQTYVVGVNNAGGTGGIYRTTNGGTSWTKVGPASSIISGPPLVTSKNVIYYVEGTWGGDRLIKSSDGGATWTEVGPSGSATFSPVELPDGRIVSISNNKLTVSGDGGNTWTNFGPTIPINVNSMIYSSGNNAFYVSYFDCRFDGTDVVPSNAIMRLK